MVERCSNLNHASLETENISTDKDSESTNRWGSQILKNAGLNDLSFNSLKEKTISILIRVNSFASSFDDFIDWFFNGTVDKNNIDDWLQSAKVGNLHRILKYIELGIDVEVANETNQTAIHFAVEHENIEALKALLKVGANIEKTDLKGNTPLIKAINTFQFGHECIQILVNSKANLNITNKIGESLIYLAVKRGRTDMLKTLIKAGIDIEKTDFKGNTPLLEVIDDYHIPNRIELVQILIDAKANLNAANNEGNTSLHIAAKSGTFSLVKLLIQSKANINAKNKSSLTPLFLAVFEKKFTIIKQLLEAGADVRIRTSKPIHTRIIEYRSGTYMPLIYNERIEKNSSILDFAKQVHASSEIQNLLIEYGAQN
ncbi:MAG: Phosphocholine transferase AnkX [Chlamydiae bacterium]|nr:Phosphocholine transferase AnkX [Chlamydiota bacterium]